MIFFHKYFRIYVIFLSFSMLSEIYVQVIVKIAMATKIPISLPIAN